MIIPLAREDSIQPLISLYYHYICFPVAHILVHDGSKTKAGSIARECMC